MKEISDSIYRILYNGLSLQTAGLIVGLVLIAVHLVALLKASPTKEWLQKLPRNQSIGTWVLAVAFILAMIVATSMDLGEFSRMRWLAQFAVPAMFLSLLFYTNEYLGARSLGILVILIVCPVLLAAFLKSPPSRVLLSGLCYVYILLGLFWIGMPHTLRDQIGWVTKTDGRFKMVALSGLAFGVVILACALTLWGGA